MFSARSALLLSAALLIESAMAGGQTARSPVVVELFTSEGCSSCPPADALLARLDHDQPVSAADVIVIEEHVDYWDSLGWRDRFSSHAFTDRQSRYTQRLHADDNYTPQMIVDGTDQFVGSDATHALRSIAQAARAMKVPLLLSPLHFEGSRVSGAVSVPSASGRALQSDLYAAVIQKRASTQIDRGENGGRTLHHVSVLRGLQRIGTAADGKSESLKFSIATPQDAPPEELEVVVLLQSPDQGAILGAVTSSGVASSPVGRSVAAAQLATGR